MSGRPETRVDLALARTGYRLLGYADTESIMADTFGEPPLPVSLSLRWAIIGVLWCVGWAVVEFAFLGILFGLHSARLPGKRVVDAGMVSVAAVAAVGAVDALWRTSLAWPVCQSIRRRDILETRMPPALRIVQWDNHRLVLQLVAGCCGAVVGAIWAYP
jgi:hypothetical protein